jgi:16S rRNA (adenine1518-N6/adenine1519-N6)-dimethyltransferase
LGHRPRKRFGQHFLHDPRVTARILAAIDPQPGERVTELTPRLDVLTFLSLRVLANLGVAEIDPARATIGCRSLDVAGHYA